MCLMCNYGEVAVDCIHIIIEDMRIGIKSTETETRSHSPSTSPLLLHFPTFPSEKIISMTPVVKVVTSVGPKLVPFFKTVAIYFVIFVPQDKPSVFATILKCLPIVSLMLFVLLHGMSLGEEYKYSRRILSGLIFCCIGDALLVWNQYFDLGMVAFIIGHVHYILAFGFKPLNLPVGIVTYFLGTLVVLYLLPGLHDIFIVGVPIYIFVIATMLWRAIARAQFFEDSWTWSKFCTCVGSVLFALSDLTIGIDRFINHIEYAQILVMSTYYAAQVGIALSVVDATINVGKDKKTMKNEGAKKRCLSI